MSANPAHPRFVCRIVRFCAHTLGTDVSHHLAACEDCQQYFEAASDLESALRQDAAPTRVEAPASLERNILRAVAAERRETASRTVGRDARSPDYRPAASWRKRVGVPLFAGTALAMIALAFVLSREKPATTPSASDLALNPQDVRLMLDAANRFSDRWWNSILPSTATAVQENPLKQEIDLVVADARSAIDFLAMNFLPAPANEIQPATSRGTI